MKTKKVFRWSAGIAVIILIIVLILLNTLPPVLSNSEGISLYGTLVSIVVGLFTVWGLYWAASEFSEAQVKPDLELIIGAAHPNGVVPLPIDTEELWGQDNIHEGYKRSPVSKVVFGLFLENRSPKAAQFVRITLRLKDSPKPLKFVALGNSFQYYEPKINTVQQEAVFLQFGQDLIVYEGDGVYLGAVEVEWEKDVRPENLVLNAGLYNLIGNPKTVVVSRSINWN